MHMMPEEGTVFTAHTGIARAGCAPAEGRRHAEKHIVEPMHVGVRMGATAVFEGA